MTKTVADIENEIKELEAQKKKVLRDTRKEVIKEIIKTISNYDIKADELFKAQDKNKEKSKPLYQNPADSSQTWTGKGRQPSWLKSYIEAGNLLETALIKE